MRERLRRTPLAEEHRRLGARMVAFAGYEMPARYAGIIEEHRAVRSSAGVFDACHMGEFRVHGSGAFEYLQGLFTNDLARTADVGSAQYTLMCDQDGGIIDDLIVYHSGDWEYLLVVNASNRQTDWDWLSERCPVDAELSDESDRTALVALQGPRALEIMRELAGPSWMPPARFSIGEARLDSIPVLAARTGYTGEDGFELLCHESAAAPLWRLLMSLPVVAPCGLGARDTLRLEMGYPLHGQDMDRGVDPISAGLSRVVARDKGEYIGREAIERIRVAGPLRRRVGLVVEGAIPRPGCAVLREGIQVGMVASGTFSPTLQTGIATAYLPSDFTGSGTVIEVAIRKKTATATVGRLPFVKNTSLGTADA